MVDIRPAAQRTAEGGLPGALVVERNVLEWRFDPASEARPDIADHDLAVIVLCQEGYTSSLAAAALQELGVWRATDVGWLQGLAGPGVPLRVGPSTFARTPDGPWISASEGCSPRWLLALNLNLEQVSDSVSGGGVASPA